MARPASQDPALQLLPASARARGWLFVLAVALPVAIAILAVGLSGRYAHALRWSGGAAIPDALLAVLAVAGCTCLAWFVLDRALRRHRLTLDESGIEVATTFYRQRLALSDLKLADARVVDLDEHTGFRTLLKTNGVGLPGFHSGWFRLRDWHKAFVATSDGRRVVWIPTTRGFGLLLQPRQPQALLERLRGMTATTSRR